MEPGEPEARRRGGWFARALRRVAGAVAWLVLTVLAVLGSALYHLDAPPGRTHVCGALGPLVSDAIPGTLEVGTCRSLSPGRLRLEDIVARSPEGSEVLRIAAVELRANLGALFSGRLRVDTLRIEGPEVSLVEEGDELALLATFVDDAEDEDPPSDDPLPSIRVDSVRVTEGSVRDAPESLAVRDLDLRARVRVGPTLRIDLDSASLAVDQEGAPLASLDSLTGHLEPEVGGSAELRLEATAADDASVRARAALTFVEAEDGAVALGPLELDLDADVRPTLLGRLGEAELAASLATPVSLRAELRGTLAALTLDARLDTEAGVVDLDARATGVEDPDALTLDASLDTSRFALPQLMHGLEGVASGRVEAHLAPEDGARRIRVRVHDVSFDEWSLDAAEVAGVLQEEEERFVLEEVAVPHLEEGGHLDVDGAVSFGGDVDLRLDARLPQLARDENLRRLVPGLRAGVEAELDVHLQGEHLDARGRLAVNGVRVSGIAVTRAGFSGRVHGVLPLPNVDAVLTGEGIVASGVHVRDARLTVRGSGAGPTARYSVDASAALPEQDGHADLDIALRTHRGGVAVVASGTASAGGVLPERVHLRLDDVRFTPNEAVELTRVAVESGDLRASVEGRYAFRRRSDLRATIEHLALADLEPFIGRPLGGVAEVEARFEGTLRAPELSARGAVTDLATEELTPTDVGFDVDLSQVDGHAQLGGQVHVSTVAGTLDLRLGGTFASSDPARWEQTEWDLGVHGEDVDVALLPTLAAQEPPDGLEGRVDVDGTIRGQLRAPDVDLGVHATNVRLQGGDPLALDADVTLGAGDLVLRAKVADAERDVATAEVDARLDVGALLDGRGPEDLDALLREPFSISVQVPGRRLDALPRPLRQDLPIKAAVELALTQGAAGLRGSMRADARWEGEDPEGCRTQVGTAPPELVVVADLQDARTEVELRGYLGGRRALDGRAAARTPLMRWVQRPPESPPVVTAQLHAADLALAGVPVVCEHADGLAGFDADIRDLFGLAPRVALRGRLHDVHVEDATEAVDAQLDAELGTESAHVHATMLADDRDALELRADAPVRWGGDDLVPALTGEPFEASLSLNHAPAAVLLAPVPLFAQPAGHFDGELGVRGTGPEDVVVRGALRLDRISGTLERPLQRFENVNGTVRFEERAVVIDGLAFRDREGTLRVDGRVELDAWNPTSAEVVARAERMPVRAEGVVMAFVDARADVGLELEEDARRVDVRLRDVAVRLPEGQTRTTQSLDQHADVVYEDQPGFDAPFPPEEEAPPLERVQVSGSGDVPTMVSLETQPFWVRREDFAIQLQASLRVNYAEEARIDGRVRVRRGVLDLLGRSFELQRGELLFTGGASVDPRLDLEAVHELASGDTVTVNITGFLSEPELHFSTSVPDVSTEREVIQLLVSGRGNDTEQTAEQQARGFLAGMTAGLISSLARRRMGGLIPVLAIESDGSTGARVRVGFQADRLIPERLRRVVRGVYVEGFVGSEQEDGEQGSRQTTAGFLIELLFPYDLVTTGTFEDSSNWTLDLTWEP